MFSIDELVHHGGIEGGGSLRTLDPPGSATPFNTSRINQLVHVYERAVFRLYHAFWDENISYDKIQRILRTMTSTFWTWGRFKHACELLNLRALKFQLYLIPFNGKISCLEFPKCPLKFHTRYLAHTWKGVYFIWIWTFKNSWNHKRFRNGPQTTKITPTTTRLCYVTR